MDINKISSRVNWLILANAGGAPFNNTVDDERFNIEEIKRACIETEAEVFRTLAESYHPARVNFLDWAPDLAHGDTIPMHFGTVEAIQIKPYTGAEYQKGKEVPSASEINDWRANLDNVFGSYGHTEAGSALAGYYYLENSTIYFTGLSARAKISTYIPNFSTLALQLSDDFAGITVCGAVAKIKKDGTSGETSSYFAGQYIGLTNQLRAGMRQLPEIQEMKKVGA